MLLPSLSSKLKTQWRSTIYTIVSYSPSAIRVNYVTACGTRINLSFHLPLASQKHDSTQLLVSNPPCLPAEEILEKIE